MALGCSSNSVLHLLAIANEAGVDLSLDTFNEYSAKVPNLCHLAPAGDTHMQDLNAAGGIQAVLNELDKKGLIDTSHITASGKTVGENIEGKGVKDYSIIRPVGEPYSETGGIAILWGNIAQNGCVVKRSAVAPEMLVHTGPARVFDSEEDSIAAIFDGEIRDGDVVVIRYEGPKGGPGMIVCFDRHFPESFRTCVLKGADLIIVPVANDKSEPLEIFRWEIRIPAYQNGVNAVMINRVGVEGEMDFCGETMAVNYDGSIAAIADDSEQLLTAEFDTEGAREFRKEKQYVSLMRPEIFAYGQSGTTE